VKCRASEGDAALATMWKGSDGTVGESFLADIVDFSVLQVPTRPHPSVFGCFVSWPARQSQQFGLVCDRIGGRLRVDGSWRGQFAGGF
jgi:hypothetical protein